MQLWLVLIVAGAIFWAIFLFGALRLEIEAKGFGEPNGSWAVAFGIDTALVALAGVIAAGTPARLELLTLGRRFALPRLSAAPKAKKSSGAVLVSRVWGRTGQALRSLSMTDAIELLVTERQRIAVDALEVDLAYGFRDIVLTGKLAGALYALSGALPARVRLRHRPRWDGGERFELAIHGTLSLWLGRVLAELVWFMLGTRTGPEKVSR